MIQVTKKLYFLIQNDKQNSNEKRKILRYVGLGTRNSNIKCTPVLCLTQIFCNYTRVPAI